MIVCFFFYLTFVLYLCNIPKTVNGHVVKRHSSIIALGYVDTVYTGYICTYFYTDDKQTVLNGCCHVYRVYIAYSGEPTGRY